MQTHDLHPIGLLDGDLVVVDESETAVSGDKVLAEIEMMESIVTRKVVRIFQPPFLLNPEASASSKAEYIDDHRVKVVGVIVRSWRKHR